jgi:hypothetical protein
VACEPRDDSHGQLALGRHDLAASQLHSSNSSRQQLPGCTPPPPHAQGATMSSGCPCTRQLFTLLEGLPSSPAY